MAYLRELIVKVWIILWTPILGSIEVCNVLSTFVFGVAELSCIALIVNCNLVSGASKKASCSAIENLITGLPLAKLKMPSPEEFDGVILV